MFFGLGTVGVAIATSIGFAANTIYFLISIHQRSRQGNPMLSLSPKKYRPTLKLKGQVLSIGIPGALITIMLSFSNIVLNNYIGIYGSSAVASYGIVFKINTMPIMILVGLAQGVAPLIGYTYGAKEYTRLKKTMNFSIIYSIVIGAAFTCTFIVTRKILVSLFLKDADLIEQAGLFLCILCASNIVVGIINMVTSYFQACGKALPSLFITIGKSIVIFIPTVVLFNAVFGLTGVISAQPFVEFTITAVCIVMYLVSVRKLGSKNEQTGDTRIGRPLLQK